MTGLHSVVKFPLNEGDVKHFYCDDLYGGDISIVHVEKYDIFTLCLRQDNTFEILHGYTENNLPINTIIEKSGDINLNIEIERFNFDTASDAIKAFNKLTGESLLLKFL